MDGTAAKDKYPLREYYHRGNQYKHVSKITSYLKMPSLTLLILLHCKWFIDWKTSILKKQTTTQTGLWLWNSAERAGCMSSHPLPWSDPCSCEMFLSCVKLYSWMSSGRVRWVWLTSGVTRRQWWPGLLLEEQNRDPQAHGPCCRRSLEIWWAILGKEKKEEGKGSGAELHPRGCFGSKDSIREVSPLWCFKLYILGFWSFKVQE